MLLSYKFLISNYVKVDYPEVHKLEYVSKFPENLENQLDNLKILYIVDILSIIFFRLLTIVFILVKYFCF